MGIRRLRNRLDTIQGEAQITMEKFQILADEFMDGFTVEAEIEMTEPLREFIGSVIAGLVAGKGVTFPRKLPIKGHFKVTPEED